MWNMGKLQVFPAGSSQPRGPHEAAMPVILDVRSNGVSCEEKARLAKDYDESTSRFSEAVRELRRRMGTSPKDEYDRLERASNEARVKSEQARLALEQHIAAHHC